MSGLEELLAADPWSPELDRLAVQAGSEAVARLQQARAFEQRLRAALAIDLPATLDQTLARLPERAEAEFEARLAQALAVPVPAALAGQLAALPQREDPRTAHWFNRRGIWALAASLLLTVGLAGGWMLAGRPGQPAASNPLLQASVEHLVHEPFALTRTETVPAPMLDNLLRQAGLSLREAVEVNYAYPCPIGGQRTVHMVMQRPGGPVTVIWFRQGDVVRAATDFSHAGMQGRAIPLDSGMLVMIGADRAAFADVEQIWRGAASA